LTTITNELWASEQSVFEAETIATKCRRGKKIKNGKSDQKNATVF